MGQQTEAIIGQLPTGGPGRNNAKLSRERLPKSGGCRSEVHAIPREHRIAVGFEVENRVAYEGFISPVPEIEPKVEGDRDDDGFLYLLDRKKDMIASGGVSVFVSDIEEILMQQPDVQEVAVIRRRKMG